MVGNNAVIKSDRIEENAWNMIVAGMDANDVASLMLADMID